MKEIYHQIEQPRTVKANFLVWNDAQMLIETRSCEKSICLWTAQELLGNLVRRTRRAT